MISKPFLAGVLVLLSFPYLVGAEEDSKAKVRKENPPIAVEEIIRKFAEKEQEFQKARENYIYRQTVRIEVLELDGRRSGLAKWWGNLGCRRSKLLCFGFCRRNDRYECGNQGYR